MVKQLVEEEIIIPVGLNQLSAILTIPPQAKAIVIFSHSSGNSRLNPRNQLMTRYLHDQQMATLLLDLLTYEEEKVDEINRELRCNIPLLVERLIAVTEWIMHQETTQELTVGFFGASSGAAAALIATSELKGKIAAVVSRGGRTDLASSHLTRVEAPTLLIVGGADFGVIELNQSSFELLTCTKKLEIIPKATHHFEEEGALEEVGRLATLWFTNYI